MKDIEALSDLMDTKFTIFGFRFGLDGLIGLIPVAGDVVTSFISFYIVLRAFMMGFPLIVIIRMLLNILIDFVFGAVPIFGNVFDFIWKANTRNIQIMKEYASTPISTKKRSSVLLVCFALLVFLTFFLLIYVFFKILSLIYILVL